MNSFSPQQQIGTTNINPQAAAAALSALQQFVPTSFANSIPFRSFQSLDSSAFAQFAAAAQSQALSSSAAQSLLNASLGRDSHRHNEEDHHSSRNRSSTNPATPQQQNGQSTARSRLMFDPLSELPILERWFEENPHPGWLQIEQYTDSLNQLQYRQNYPVRYIKSLAPTFLIFCVNRLIFDIKKAKVVLRNVSVESRNKMSNFYIKIKLFKLHSLWSKIKTFII